jgi:hypothetical protein
VGSESLAKAYILTHGVAFTGAALEFASHVGAKRQNMVYNAPAIVDRGSTKSANSKLSSQLARPQELFLRGENEYDVCVSAVAPVTGRESAVVDCVDGKLILATPGRPRLGQSLPSLDYVPEPSYYARFTRSGRPVTRWVSACGYDEMNVWPWHDCAISRPCSFCGINAVHKHTGRNLDLLHARAIQHHTDALAHWNSTREEVVGEILEAIDAALDDECYRDEVHLILISGNLADQHLNAQAAIYADISRAIMSRHPLRFAEGVVAVTAPPLDLDLLVEMRQGGIRVAVFNLEAFTPTAFSRHCPGKARVGRSHYLEALMKGVEIFGRGNIWSNFVLGLEPQRDLLAGCAELASKGVTPGANVYHRDQGATATLDPPTYDAVLDFYRELASLYQKYGLRPYYCRFALRTSLANEAFDGKLGPLES